MLRKLGNFATFQAAWFAAVLGAARDNAWIGPSVISAVVALHVLLAHDRARAALFLLLSLPIGLVVNTVLAASGAIVAPGPVIGPMWLLLLWPAFATLFDESMAWMRGRYRTGVVFAAVGAPLSYYAAERAGAVRVHASTLTWVGLVVITWSIAIVSLLALHQRLAARVRAGT